MRPIAEVERSIQMLVYDDRAASQRRFPTHRFNLQSQILKAHGVVPVHRAFKLQREDALQFPLPICPKGAARETTTEKDV